MPYPGDKKYYYEGPVEEFGRCIDTNWSATTYAPTEKRARSNLEYRYKKEHNKIPSTPVKLPGKIVLLG